MGPAVAHYFGADFVAGEGIATVAWADEDGTFAIVDFGLQEAKALGIFAEDAADFAVGCVGERWEGDLAVRTEDEQAFL